MTETATQERRTAQPLEDQEHATKPPKSKAASRKRGKRTPEQEAADKAKKAEVEGQLQPGERIPSAKQSAKQHTPPEQTKFEGDGFPEDPPKEVCKARDEYLGAMRAAAAASEHKGDRKERLIELMREHGINRIKLDGENKFFELEDEFKVKMKTMPKDQRDRGKK